MRLYARQASLKMFGSDHLRQPPVRQIMHALVRLHGVPIEQLVQEWHDLLAAHPFVEVVSLAKRVSLKRSLSRRRIARRCSSFV
jgi:hypothetical protein